ncbi:hypothetical protein SKM62_11960 [Acinetobacter faecalis]|uniref:hypothetical protein n=1 Tax=Acinetobacter faecalis TaxID=2665161 RepID=UPI002A91E87F|nr:hypothetical protein [Acinetobacter faecalis]MDY6537617.1 hypothetical protein [Acinetobacter faecalis]
MKKLILITSLSIASSFLLGCVGLGESKYTGQYALNSCSSCVAQFKTLPDTRLLNLKVTSNDPELNIAYEAMSGPFRKLGKIQLTKGNFDGVIRIPDNTGILVTADYDPDISTLTGTEVIGIDENSAVVKLTISKIEDQLKSEFNQLTNKQKKELVNVIGSFDVALNSPKMLYSSKLAEAEKEANSFLIDMPAKYKNTKIYSELSSLRIYMKLIDISPNGEMVWKASNKLRLLKKAFSN